MSDQNASKPPSRAELYAKESRRIGLMLLGMVAILLASIFGLDFVHSHFSDGVFTVVGWVDTALLLVVLVLFARTVATMPRPSEEPNPDGTGSTLAELLDQDPQLLEKRISALRWEALTGMLIVPGLCAVLVWRLLHGDHDLWNWAAAVIGPACFVTYLREFLTKDKAEARALVLEREAETQAARARLRRWFRIASHADRP